MKHKNISAIVAAVCHMTTPPHTHTHTLCPLKNNERMTPLVCIISVTFYEILRIHSKVNLVFSYISVWMRKF